MTRTLLGGGFAAALAIGVAFGGAATASAQTDWSTLPINPNEVIDSTAFVAETPSLNPGGQPGVLAVFTHRDGTRTVSDSIAVLPTPQAATDAMNQERATQGGLIAAPVITPSPAGTGGSISSGKSPDGTRSLAVLTFTEGDTFTVVEFEGPANDPVPLDVVNEYGQRQAGAIRAAQAG
ncbi:hypothetical protein [Mycolicibacterium sp. S2-37]|uniref:hypothetical protein n=1 Tax=Mycolicibacterium sp. S2-37 TaxID=2810297 RepID=UPI001F5F7843|nr:hypothetical protein [Mycolicibacterium sp. S2-37]